MLLKELYANVQQQRDQLDRQRHTQANQLTLQARQLIEQATAEAFSNKALLSEAVELLMSAIQNHRQYLDAYLYLAYLCFLIGDDQSALAYLKDAQAIDAQHPIAQSLKAEILRLRFAHLNSASKPEPAPIHITDSQQALDEDELLRMILQSIRRISDQHPSLIELTRVFEPEVYQTARQFQQQLLDRYAFFEKQIACLERDFDVMALRNALRPFEIFLRRCQLQLDKAQSLMALQRQIQRELRVVSQIQEQLQGLNREGLLTLERKLEQSLDQADWFADQLDALEQDFKLGKLGALPQPLLQAYESLAALSQEVMDKLDEQSSR